MTETGSRKRFFHCEYSTRFCRPLLMPSHGNTDTPFILSSGKISWFQQNHYVSFTRQVTLYGFKRLTSGKQRRGCGSRTARCPPRSYLLCRSVGRDSGSYYHELFLRGKSFLCRHMRRSKIVGDGRRKATSPETEPNFWTMTHLPESPPPRAVTTSSSSSSSTPRRPVEATRRDGEPVPASSPQEDEQPAVSGPPSLAPSEAVGTLPPVRLGSSGLLAASKHQIYPSDVSAFLRLIGESPEPQTLVHCGRMGFSPTLTRQAQVEPMSQSIPGRRDGKLPYVLSAPSIHMSQGRPCVFPQGGSCRRAGDPYADVAALPASNSTLQSGDQGGDLNLSRVLTQLAMSLAAGNIQPTTFQLLSQLQALQNITVRSSTIQGRHMGLMSESDLVLMTARNVVSPRQQSSQVQVQEPTAGHFLAGPVGTGGNGDSATRARLLSALVSLNRGIGSYDPMGQQDREGRGSEGGA